MQQIEVITEYLTTVQTSEKNWCLGIHLQLRNYPIANGQGTPRKKK